MVLDVGAHLKRHFLLFAKPIFTLLESKHKELLKLKYFISRCFEI